MIITIRKIRMHGLCGWVLAFSLFGSIPLAAQTITLNLKEADISALIGTVAEVTGKNFIVDPRVKGKVTVISSRPMDSDEVYQVFLSILRVHGFAAVKSGAVTKILPDVNAKQDSIPNATAGRPGRGDEMVTRVVQVDNIAAAQLVPILRPLVPQQGHLAAYPATNVLIISDRAQNVSRLISIIQRIDKVSDSEIEVIRLEHASASEVVRVLTAIRRTKAQPGQAQQGGNALVADERTNSILLGGDRSSRLRMRAIISHLDTPLGHGGNTKVIYLKYAKAKDIIDVLRGVGKTQSETAKGKNPVAKNIEKQLDIQADEATNALVITAPPAMMLSLESVIRQLDIRRAQILVDAIIAEVSLKRTRELGVQWVANDPSDSGISPLGGTNFTNVGNSAASVAAAIASGAGSLAPGLLLAGASLSNGTLDFAALVQALGTDKDVNILSTPSLVTLDNEEAEFVVGQNVPFVTGSFSTTGSDATNPFQTIQREDVGISLKIKPQINEGDAIIMEIEQEISSVNTDAKAVDTVTDKRSLKTNVIVEDGQTLVLGGLIQDNVNQSQQKVPILGDLPLIGALFRAKSTTHDKTNLMVFIHPTILRDKGIANQYSSRKYNLMRAKQIEAYDKGISLIPGEAGPQLPELENLNDLPRALEKEATERAMRPQVVQESEWEFEDP
ncbi:MAG: type II secretion system secretin GspD [Gammaproteobacteria bacterium]